MLIGMDELVLARKRTAEGSSQPDVIEDVAMSSICSGYGIPRDKDCNIFNLRIG